jgi:hypothetical protein
MLLSTKPDEDGPVSKPPTDVVELVDDELDRSTVLTAEVRDHIRASAHLLWNDSDGLGATGEDGLLVLANTPEPLSGDRQIEALVSFLLGERATLTGRDAAALDWYSDAADKAGSDTPLAALASEKASDAQARVLEFEARRASRWRRVRRPSKPLALGTVLAVILAVGVIAAILFARDD